MSTYVWVQIQIGGALRRAGLPRFLDTCALDSEAALDLFIINDRLVLDRCGDTAHMLVDDDRS